MCNAHFVHCTACCSLRSLFVTCLFLKKSRHPYSKMCELCELCELFVKKSHRFCDGIILFLLSRIYSSFSGTPEIYDFLGEEE